MLDINNIGVFVYIGNVKIIGVINQKDRCNHK